MLNFEIYLKGLEMFLNKNKALSDKLKQEAWIVRRELGNISSELVQFAVSPHANQSVVSFDAIRKNAILSVTMTDDLAWIENNKKTFNIDDYKKEEILFFVSIVENNVFEYKEPKQVTRGELPNIIENFNEQFGSAFLKESYMAEEMSMEDLKFKRSHIFAKA